MNLIFLLLAAARQRYLVHVRQPAAEFAVTLPTASGRVEPTNLRLRLRGGGQRPDSRSIAPVLWQCDLIAGYYLHKTSAAVGRSVLSLESNPVTIDFSRLILIPDHAQKSAIARRRRNKYVAALETFTRSSANPRAGDRRLEMVWCPSPPTDSKLTLKSEAHDLKLTLSGSEWQSDTAWLTSGTRKSRNDYAIMSLSRTSSDCFRYYLSG